MHSGQSRRPQFLNDFVIPFEVPRAIQRAFTQGWVPILVWMVVHEVVLTPAVTLDEWHKSVADRPDPLKNATYRATLQIRSDAMKQHRYDPLLKVKPDFPHRRSKLHMPLDLSDHEKSMKTALRWIRTLLGSLLLNSVRLPCQTSITSEKWKLSLEQDYN